MAISKDDIVERNFRIANNNAIDMHVGKRVRLRRSAIFSMICRKAQCVALRAGSAVAIMQTF
jgi:hypothetical protein